MNALLALIQHHLIQKNKIGKYTNVTAQENQNRS